MAVRMKASKRKLVEPQFTEVKSAKVKKPKVKKAEAPLEPPMGCFAKGAEVVEAEHAAKLLQLFVGIDLVLQLVAGRQRHTPLEQLQESVLAQTRCDLTEERLRQVLHVGGGMLAAQWIGEGHAAYLSVEQRDKAGKHTRPEAAELEARQLEFAERLKSVPVPSPLPELPARPVAQPPRKLLEKPEVAPHQDLDLSALPLLLPPGQGTAKERFEALRRHVKAKEAILKKAAEHEAQVRQLTKRIGICEDAILAARVLGNLLDARFVNRASSAPSWRQKPALVPLPYKEKSFEDLIQRARVPELKLLSAVCSLTWGEQCSRPLSLEAGRAAIAQLREVGDGVWFKVQKVPEGGNFLACLGPGSEKVRQALKTKIRELEEERSALRVAGLRK